MNELSQKDTFEDLKKELTKRQEIASTWVDADFNNPENARIQIEQISDVIRALRRMRMIIQTALPDLDQFEKDDLDFVIEGFLESTMAEQDQHQDIVETYGTPHHGENPAKEWLSIYLPEVKQNLQKLIKAGYLEETEKGFHWKASQSLLGCLLWKIVGQSNWAKISDVEEYITSSGKSLASEYRKSKTPPKWGALKALLPELE